MSDPSVRADVLEAHLVRLDDQRQAIARDMAAYCEELELVHALQRLDRELALATRIIALVVQSDAVLARIAAAQAHENLRDARSLNVIR